MTNKNLGRFRIDSRFIHEQPERVAEVFKIMKCVPVRAEMIYYSNEIEYMAISELFPELEYGKMIPDYTLKIIQNESGSVESVNIIEGEKPILKTATKED